jgi:hypothetical protein
MFRDFIEPKDGLELMIFCIGVSIEELDRGTGARALDGSYAIVSFLGLGARAFVSQLSLFVLSWPLAKLEIELWRRFASNWEVDLTEGLGLGTTGPIQVADAGSFGGGMLSCFCVCVGYSGPRSVAAYEVFDELLLQLRLSFRRSEDADEGVSGSAGLDDCGVSFFTSLMDVCARGPFNLVFLGSVAVFVAVYSSLFFDRNEPKSPLDLGREVEMKGECDGCPRRLLATGCPLELESLPSRRRGVSDPASWVELVLLICKGVWIASSSLRSLKKLAFEAVIGVLGVALWFHFGGGVEVPSSTLRGSCRALTLAIVGVLKGNKLRGGNRNGCKFFLLTLEVSDGLDSPSNLSPTLPRFRRSSSSIFKGSRKGVVGNTSAVDELAALLVSRGKLDLRTANRGYSICSLGDSYAFGIAGTGGTSSSVAAEL